MLEGHGLYFWCPDDHVQGIAVKDLLDLKNPPFTVDDAFDRARCSVCGKKAVDVRIVFMGCKYTG